MMDQMKYNYVIFNAFISNYQANIQTLRGYTPRDPEWRRVDNELFYRADHLRNATHFPRLIKLSHVDNSGAPFFQTPCVSSAFC